MPHPRRARSRSATAALAVVIVTGVVASSAGAQPAVSTDPLVTAVTASNPFLRPLGATSYAGRDLARSFGDPLPDVLAAADVTRVQIISFSGYCGGAPEAESLRAVVTTSADPSDARDLVDRLVDDAAEGGDALREASGSGTFGADPARIRVDGRRAYRFSLTGNESNGSPQAGTVVVVPRRGDVVIATALCGIGRTKKDRTERAAETRVHARAFAAAIMSGLDDRQPEARRPDRVD